MTKSTGVVLGDGEEKPYLLWERHWLKQWNDLESSDKKVLAVLYWDDLTDKQKETFSDHEYIELQKSKERQRAELISDPVKMKQHFLMGAAPILDNMISAAKGEKKISKGDEYAMREVWDVLKGVISTANNPAPMIDLKGKTIDDQISKILTSVSEGKITIEVAKDYMSLVSSGFNLQKLPELLVKLDAIEAQ